MQDTDSPSRDRSAAALGRWVLECRLAAALGLVTLVMLASSPSAARAQHGGHGQEQKEDPRPGHDPPDQPDQPDQPDPHAQPDQHDQPDPLAHHQAEASPMPHTPNALEWLEARRASGTSWQPDTTPAWGWHFVDGGRETMVHGIAFLDAVHASGPHGDDDVGLSGWVMIMQRWPVGSGRFGWRGMFSPEAAAWGERGYPELFQFGEAVDGELLVDRQHPHDFFMELAATWEAPLGARWAWHAYLAASGEPALGPTAFPHRVSAADNPQAPLGHHQQDATHISFGVATLGFSSRTVRLEASVFNGREPDQERWDIDFGPLDSYSARISVNPAPAWSLQVSGGHLVDSEEIAPGVDAERWTASAHHVAAWARGWVASALIWGSNEEDGEDPLRTLTFESTVSHGRNSAHLRWEHTDRAHLPGLADHQRATLDALTLGYSRDLHVGPTGHWALGGQVTLHEIPRVLEEEYGSSPVSFHVFGRWRPPRVTMTGGH